jgi:hypothetical protein
MPALLLLVDAPCGSEFIQQFVKFYEGKQLGRSDLLELMASLKYDFAIDRRRPSCTLVDRYAHCWGGFELCAASRTSDEF